MISRWIQQLRTTETKRLWVYIVVYFSVGIIMNQIGTFLEIAKFTHWWQVITCYLLYMIPISIILRPYSFFTQYAYGLFAMGLLEFTGYTLGTSYIYPDNILERSFGPHVFALAMTLFFGLYFPILNWVVDQLYQLIFQKNKRKIT